MTRHATKRTIPARGAHKFPPRRKIIEQRPSTEAEELARTLKSSRGSYGDGIEDTALISDDGTGNFGYANAGKTWRAHPSRDLHSCRDHGRAIDAFVRINRRSIELNCRRAASAVDTRPKD
jgi:hypothetical protein